MIAARQASPAPVAISARSPPPPAPRHPRSSALSFPPAELLLLQVPGVPVDLLHVPPRAPAPRSDQPLQPLLPPPRPHLRSAALYIRPTISGTATSLLCRPMPYRQTTWQASA